MSIARAAAVMVMVVTATAPWPRSAGSEASIAQLDEEIGRRLYVQSCASCHGPSGEGAEDGPSLLRSGEAAVDFMLRTGRMPLDKPGARTRRKPPAFAPSEIDALVDYVGALGSGPEIPEVSPESAPLTTGQSLFVANCAPCHGATAAGGAVGGRAFAPSLLQVEPIDIAEAMVIGPGEMPVFGFDDHEIAAIIRYVDFVQTQRDPGGLDIGGVGPVTEGFVAWLAGAGALTMACVALARRKKGSGS